MKYTLSLLALAAAVGLASPASAAFLVEVRTGGVGNSNFALGPNMAATVSTSTATSPAVGTTPAIGSIFGGGSPSGTTTPTPDEYLYSYTPGVDADNLSLATGTALNDDGDRAFGLTGGASGTYRVYTTWPNTTNISTGNNPTNYALSDGMSTLLSTSVVQDFDSPGGLFGNEWVLLGEVELTEGTTYTLSQTNTQSIVDDGFGTITYSNGFVSMRASGVMFERVPEPTTALLAALGLAAAGFRRR
jgi:hypothetical protein